MFKLQYLKHIICLNILIVLKTQCTKIHNFFTIKFDNRSIHLIEKPNITKLILLNINLVYSLYDKTNTHNHKYDIYHFCQHL